MVDKKRCIVCGKPIARRTHGWYFQKPYPGHEAMTSPIRMGARAARPDGHIDRGASMSTIYADQPPSDKQALQRYSNHRIVSLKRSHDGTISSFSTWDGESYADPHFHSEMCAARQGRASAQHGDRFTWKAE